MGENMIQRDLVLFLPSGLLVGAPSELSWKSPAVRYYCHLLFGGRIFF